ncbi:MAG: hypothetical protein A2Y38_23620 [Spirochaetes bacterium GWB1_59_5]|nr:MAG: hypothetical protein A2Y38_23620 [Spirochaetes bacterium GWB1_59_5]
MSRGNLTITVARKPLAEGSVAKNALKWGTGGLDIDSARIGTAAISTHAYPGYDNHSALKCKDTSVKGEPVYQGHQGRWPANLVLVHNVGCKRVGTKRVQAITGTASGRLAGKTSSVYGVYAGDASRAGEPTGFGDANGLETVDAWECKPGCPVAELDRQGGEMGTHPAGSARKPAQHHAIYDASSYQFGGNFFRVGDAGGVSRFFKQVRAQEGAMGSSLPQELVSYLCNLIGAPGRPGIYWAEINDTMIAITPDNSLPGLVLRGEPTEAQAKALMRILMPGAFLLLVAPEERPTGHVGACRIEDEGFEIRDAILVVRESGQFHYVAKAGRSEREAGCEHLKGKTGAAAVERQEGTAGLDSPRAGAGRTAEFVHNFHPTCKPVDIMECLLADVPQDALVLDPFVGSGTTGVACLRTGHSFIGIDREQPYLEIADARIRHWDRAEAGWNGATIETPFPPREPEVESLTLDDLFWGADEDADA